MTDRTVTTVITTIRMQTALAIITRTVIAVCSVGIKEEVVVLVDPIQEVEDMAAVVEVVVVDVVRPPYLQTITQMEMLPAVRRMQA